MIADPVALIQRQRVAVDAWTLCVAELLLLLSCRRLTTGVLQDEKVAPAITQTELVAIAPHHPRQANHPSLSQVGNHPARQHAPVELEIEGM